MPVDAKHVPVLLQEMLEALAPVEGGVYLDGTFGGGGYTRAILQNCKTCVVHALDRDPQALARSHALKAEYPNRFFFHQGAFSDISSLFQDMKFDGIVFDFGVSSFQLDTAERGFSFRLDGPLDMRMDPTSGIDAATVVNTFSEKDIADILYVYGEEVRSRQVAKAIVNARRSQKFETTFQLAQCVRPVAMKKSEIDSATLTFQGLRIFVNNELIEIDTALKSSACILKEQGTIVTVTFHSLEDRLCKQFFKQKNCQDGIIYSFKTKGNKPVAPSYQELKANARSRSAKLRAAVLCMQKEKSFKSLQNEEGALC